MTFKSFFKELSGRSGPAYGAGPAGFKRLMKRLGNPQQHYKIIHVAGTNGKGSVCYLTASVLREAGYQTGLFISPHLQTPTERIQINGHNISQAAFVRLCQTVLAAEIEKLNFFEILTAVAFLYFAEKKVNYGVLETGLGGRKDPTNVCVPAASVITSIGLDHCAVLGDTLSKIAYEKAGIIKPRIPVFCSSLPKEVLTVIKQEAQLKEAPFINVREGNPFRLSHINWSENQTLLQKGTQKYVLSILGEKQIQNACLVYHLCHDLGISDCQIKQGLKKVHIPGRFEVCRYQNKTVIFDGAHNPQAIKYLVKCLQKSPWAGKIALVGAFMQDKDYPAMLKLMIPHVQKFYMTTVKLSRSMPPKQLRSFIPTVKLAGIYAHPYQALQAALAAHQVVLISGSFYLVGYLRKYLQKK